MNKIKISIKLLVIAIGLLLVLQIPTFAATGKSTATNVRVRESASTNSEVIELLDENDTVKILGREGDWYKVNFKGTIGYVSCEFISTNENFDDNQKENNNNNTQNIDNKDANEPATVEPEPTKVDATPAQTVEPEPETTKANEIPTSVEPEPVETNRVYKMAETTKVNILPVINSEFIGEIAKNSEVSLISNAGLWAYIQAQNVSGWVRIDKLSTEDATNKTENNTENKTENKTENDIKEEPEVEEPKQEAYTPKTMYVNATSINVRKEANTTSDIAECLEINDTVKVVGEENGWYKVTVNEVTGYIRQDLLSTTKTEVSSRSNTVDRFAATNTQVTVEQPAAQQSAAQQSAAQQTASVVQTATTSSSSVTGTDIVNYAMQFKGCKYVYGAAGPNSFDCSGLTSYVYKHFGYTLNRSSKDQAKNGKAVTGELQPGDILLFSNNGKTIGHVGIYIGNDKFIHASDSSTGVIVSNLSDRWNKSKYWGARRIL